MLRPISNNLHALSDSIHHRNDNRKEDGVTFDDCLMVDGAWGAARLSTVRGLSEVGGVSPPGSPKREILLVPVRA